MRVVVTSKAFARHPGLVAYLTERFPDHRLTTATRQLTDDELVAFADGADAMILALEKLGEPVLARLSKLRVVAKFGVGLDNVDFDACARHGVTVLYRQGVNRHAVAELALCTTLSLLRNVHVSARRLSQGLWEKNGGRSLFGKRVGLVGFGHVGTAFTELLRPFGCDAVYHDIVDKRAEAERVGARAVALSELVSDSDVVSLHCPLTPLTRGLVDAAFLGRMKEGAVLVNTARGELVDLAALRIALDGGRLAGAAVDVFPVEPPDEPALLAHPRFLATPHIGGNAVEATLAMGRAAVDLLAEHASLQLSARAKG